MFEVIAQHPVLGFILTVYLGLLLGSFTTAVIYRTLNGQSWIWNQKRQDNQARSYCPSCQHVLMARDLIPVLSYLYSRGKCQYCKVAIGKKYILTEMAVTGLCVFIYFLLDDIKIQLSLMLLTPFIYSQISIFITDKKASKLLLGIIIFGFFIMFCLIY